MAWETRLRSKVLAPVLDATLRQAGRTALRISLAGLLFAPHTSHAQAGPRPDRVIANLQVIDFSKPLQTGEVASLDARMEYYNVPGVSIAVINDNAIEWARGFGHLQAGSAAPVNEDSIFQTASVSKYVTALLALYYVEKGVLDLDSEANRFLTSWKIPDSEFTRDKKVTLRNLLSHQSGIPNVGNIEQEKGMSDPTLAQILGGVRPALTPPALPTFEPGSQWAYSNIGYVIIQMMLEDATGKSLPLIAEEVLFRPLGMESSSFSYPLPKKLRSREAMPHGTDGMAALPDLDGLACAMGGLLSTPDDMARLTVDVMQAYQGKPSKVISQATARLLVTKQIDVPIEALGVPLSDGLGVFLDATTEEVAFTHPGHNAPGSTFLIVAYPALGKGAIIATNGNIGDRLALEILAGLAIEYKWPSGQPFRR